MPPDRTSTGSSSKSRPNKPFKPPRPSGTNTTASSSRSKPTSQSHRQSAATATSASSSRPRASTATHVDSYDVPDTTANLHDDADDAAAAAETARARIPPELLTRLLHEFFTDDRVRISKVADRAVGRYMETFVREAIARAAYERETAGGGRAALGGKFMEVEDLEKLAPQLVLDF